MALTHLADTSVLTRLKAAPVRQVLGELLSQRRVGRCGMSDLELGFSARNADEWDQINRAVRLFQQVTVQPEDYTRASGVQRALAEHGLKGRKVPDLLIAAVAERHALTVLHYDRDFELIADMTGQQHQWVVPRGTID
ncbi:PIN domain nuclease [Solihabitans fulvus]|uniref:PIN domain nuclease n=1 Tax=Solihabitans fulvus TaxID=1892852 RepID=UPI001661A348|nr:PIN domain nuclease [Solihabitans fulvus]